jgi:hypothetical protein
MTQLAYRLEETVEPIPVDGRAARPSDNVRQLLFGRSVQPAAEKDLRSLTLAIRIILEVRIQCPIGFLNPSCYAGASAGTFHFRSAVVESGP